MLAREDFTCCGTSRHWQGYLWYHQQNTESLIDSPAGAVYLGYGAYPPEDFAEATYDALSKQEQEAWYQAAVKRLLDEVVFPVLRKHGMQVEWNRKQSTRILLTGARWYAPLT